MRLTFYKTIALAAVLSASACRHSGHVEQIEVSSVVLDKSSDQKDSAASVMINPYKTKLDAEMNEVLGKSDVAMAKEKDQPESLLGNFTADAVLVKANQYYKSADGHGVDISLLNNGGLRSSLPKGDITKGKIFELMPFDNEIVVVTISGEQMQNLLKYLAAVGGQPCAGLNLGIRSDKTLGAVTIQGQPFDINKTYKIATSDYLAGGGDKMSFFVNPIKTEAIGLRIRDGLIERCREMTKAGQSIGSTLDGRIHYETK